MKPYFRDLLVEDKDIAKVVLMGIPFDEGCSCFSGAKDAPQTIRELSKYLPAYTMDGQSISDLKIYDAGDFYKSSDFYQELEKKSLEVFDLNKFSLFIGGDHSISISLEKSFLEYQKKLGKTPVIIHIDAHPDICDFYDGKYTSHACPNKRALDNGYLEENITLIGIRGYEHQEVLFLNEHKNLKVYNASFLNEAGFDECLKDLINRYSSDSYAIYLSYDIDANDPSFAPGTGTPEAFGLNSYKLMQFIKELFKNLNILAMDLVEVSPKLDSNNITSWVALKTLYEIFGIINQKE